MSRWEPDGYVVADAHSALAEDPRVSEPSLKVEMIAGKLCITGTVANEARRAAIEEVLRDRFPGLGILNQTSVADMSEAADPENVA